MEWFYKKVNDQAPWDYKNTGKRNGVCTLNNPEFENFGNWHYGVVGAAAGIPEWALLNAAGLAQFKSGTSKLKYLRPPCNGLGCFDDPNDQDWISIGATDYTNGTAFPLRGRDY